MFTHSLKRLLAKACIAAVLFSQLAVAAYACPTVGGPAAAIAAIAATIADDRHAAMPGCEMRDAGNPNLCLQHCQAGDQSVQSLTHVPVPAFAALSTFAVIEPVQLKADVGVAVWSFSPARETSPPPLVRFRVLRI